MIRGAGILLVSSEGRVLLLKRGPGGDYPGQWCIPGGRAEGEETAVQAAMRETLEESGFKVDESKLVLWTRRISAPEPAPLEAAASTRPTPPLEVLKELAKPLEQPEPVAPENVDFTTFAMKGVKEFIPDMSSGEHTAYAWAPVSQPPEPLHPGCRIAFARFSMNELGVAQAMAAGELSSPQRYGQFSLFNIRITGTGVAYRQRHMDGKKVLRDEEFVYRNPEHYLTDEFLARCNGLPVLMEHPPGTKNALDSDEFNKRTIGTVFMPYLRMEAKEVWAVCKIYDEDAVEIMTEKQLSTSPGVVWRTVDANVKTEIDGHNFLLEDKPSLMDHIAVCYQGVWDKGGRPAGVETADARKDAVTMMTEEELKKHLEAQKGETDTAIKTILGAVESLGGTVGKIVLRMDAEDKEKEEGRKDAARGRKDAFKFSARKDGESDEDFKGRRDAEEEELRKDCMMSGDSEDDAKKHANDSRKDAEDGEEKARKDADDAKKKDEDARKDSALTAENKELKDRLATLEARIPAQLPRDVDPAGFAAAQSRFDEVFSALGMKTPQPMQGEPLLTYRKRGAIELKKYSSTFKEAELDFAAANDSIFSPIEKVILTEAAAMARSDAIVPAGQLREVPETLATGHKSTKFYGDPAAWMSDFAPSARFAEIVKHNANGLKR